VIRRQKDEALREVVRVASEAGGADRAVQLLERAGRVVEIPDARLRHETITRDFIADGGRGMVIAPSNAERQDLNHRIREALIYAGRVERKSVKAPVVVKGMGREEAAAGARALLTKVGLSDRLDYYPSQLSGGQQQRAAIARALAMSPQVMLYDEPTSSLDPTLVNEVLQIMRQLHDEGMTQVVVTHEMRFARDVADTILFMHEGRLVEAGPPAALFSSPRDPRTREFLKSFL